MLPRMGSFILRFLRRILPCAQDVNQMRPNCSDSNNQARSAYLQPPGSVGSTSEQSQDSITPQSRVPSRIVDMPERIPDAVEEDLLYKPDLSTKTSCRCGEAESCVFLLPMYDTDPFFGIRITWIPCPAHPCPHSPAEVLVGDVGQVDPPTEATTRADGNKRCICSSYEQMMAQPEARKKYEIAQGCPSGPFPLWPWMK